MICINAQFNPKQLEIFAEFNIIVPVEGEFYSIRHLLHTRFGDAYLLNEITNPLIPDNAPGTVPEDQIKFEPGFGTWRFKDEEFTFELTEKLESVTSEDTLV